MDSREGFFFKNGPYYNKNHGPSLEALLNPYIWPLGSNRQRPMK